jgi:hypothetical protein
MMGDQGENNEWKRMKMMEVNVDVMINVKIEVERWSERCESSMESETRCRSWHVNGRTYMAVRRS